VLEILEFIRAPAVVTILATISGIGVGLAAESESPRALWGSAIAVCLTGLSLASLAPDAFLAPTGVVLGFAATALLRDRLRRRQVPGGESTE
jgi:hypothetical protein